ncbi:protein spaetzle-like [Zophobas morio]|uniref:protein spaetzle-like n=1 Tax=Zophobas morio TaxID=2755281 RepID=UPI003083A968
MSFNIIFCFCFLASFSEAIPLQKGTTHDIIFPDDSDTLATYVPHCTNNRTFCEDVTMYPEHLFYPHLRNSTYEKEYFHYSDQDHLAERFHPDKENLICVSRTTRYHPKVACNSKNECKFVYNFDKYKQEITTEECVGETSCTHLQEFPRGVRTKCVQKYSDALLLVADGEGKPVWDVFWFPTACICAYGHVMDMNFT